MRNLFLLFLLTATASFAQSSPATQSNVTPAGAPSATAATVPGAEIPPTAPVLTLHGFCPDKPAGTDPKSPDCQTVVTRADFEHLVNTLSPNLPAAARQTMAGDYAQMLVMSNEARKRGIENTPRFKDLMNLLKLQVLTQEMLRTMQDESKPSSAEVEKYYADNAPSYRELSVKRLFIPRNRPETTPDAKAAPNATSKQVTDADLQTEGEKAKARLVAGEEFDKVEKELYATAGFKTPPPPTIIPNWRQEAVPQSEQHLFDLKPKEFSTVMVEPAGAYVYQLQEIKTIPLADVRAQIESLLTRERMQVALQAIRGSVRPELNQAYFHAQPAVSGPSPTIAPKAVTSPTPAPPATKAPDSSSPPK
jgi:hypothetical protein